MADKLDLDYQLEPFSPALRDAYLALLPEQQQAVAAGKLEWKLRDNPAGAGLIAVARHGSEVVGVNAFMPAEFALAGRRLVGYQSMDTIVSPAARGQGVFGRLINCFYERSGAALLYGFPNESSAPGFFGKLGWKRFGTVPMLVRPLRTGVVLKRVARFLPDLPVPVLARPLREARPLGRFDDRATTAWQRMATSIGCAVARDAAYLNWRLVDHPTERYDILAAPDGAFSASTVADKHGAKVGYLMEAIGDSATGAGLVAASLRLMQRQGAEIAFAWCLPGAPNYAAYRRAGFYPFTDRLRPIIINFGARAIAAADPAIEDVAAWYVSYLDSDTV